MLFLIKLRFLAQWSQGNWPARRIKRLNERKAICCRLQMTSKHRGQDAPGFGVPSSSA